MEGVQTRKRAKESRRGTNLVGNGSVNGSPKTPPTSSTKAKPVENIFLFWPNVIGMRFRMNVLREARPLISAGYSRIILATASLYYMPLHPRTCSLLYSISCLLDALDGIAARHFQQSTQFGAVLDMVTDRCTTACLLVFLSSAWPRWSILFQGLISLDLASHYMHMFATLTMGKGQSHKKVDSSRSRILHLYYTNKVGKERRLAQSPTCELTNPRPSSSSSAR